MVDVRPIDQLVTGYQQTLGRARTDLGDGWERRILLAAVVSNARAARTLLVTSVVGGDALTERLDMFLADAETDDVVGRGIKRLTDKAVDAASTVTGEIVGKAFGVSTAPTLVAIAGAVLTVAGVLQDIGEAIGAGLAVVIVAVLAFLRTNPGAVRIVYPIGRIVATAKVPEWSTTGFATALRTVDNLGRGAERLLDEELGAAARAFFQRPRPPGWEVPAKVRGAAKTVLYAAVIIIAIALVIMLFGVYKGLSEGLEEAPCGLGGDCPPPSFNLPSPSPLFSF